MSYWFVQSTKRNIESRYYSSFSSCHVGVISGCHWCIHAHNLVDIRERRWRNSWGAERMNEVMVAQSVPQEPCSDTCHRYNHSYDLATIFVDFAHWIHRPSVEIRWIKDDQAIMHVVLSKKGGGLLQTMWWLSHPLSTQYRFQCQQKPLVEHSSSLWWVEKWSQQM